MRVGQAGIDRVLETQHVKVPRKKGWPVALMSIGSALVVSGAVASLQDRSAAEIGTPVAVVGGLVAGGGVALLFLPPKEGVVHCPAFRARVTVETTFIPPNGAVATSRGDADILVDDTRLPCDDDGVADR